MEKALTIRDMVEKIRVEAGTENLQPPRGADLLRTLTSLLGNLNARIRETDMTYKKKLLQCYAQEEKANRAKIVAETTQEYLEMREARDLKELAIEITRSLKYFLRCWEEELKATQSRYGN